MKSFLSKYWKRILILIGIILILLNIVHKVIAPKTLVQEYAEFGPDVEATTIDINASNLVNDAATTAPFSEDIAKYVIIGIAVFVLLLIVSDMASKKPAKKK